MIVTHHREKTINAIVYFTKNTMYCGITKLMKLLYFLDFSHFKQTGKSVTGLDYFTWDRGPVPEGVYYEISKGMKQDMTESISIETFEDSSFIKISPKRNFDPDYFSDREIKLLENLSFIFKEAKSNDMVEATHLRNEPWDRTLREKGANQKIDYMLAVDEQDESILLEDAKEISKEISEVYKIFGVA